MKKAFEAIQALVDQDAVHTRLGPINDQSASDLLNHMSQEIDELRCDLDDAMELGDILGIAIHYMIKKGWSLEYIESLILYKLTRRFRAPEPTEV